MDIRDPLFLDLPQTESEGPSRYHGNYRSCRSHHAVQKYVMKDGDYISNMDLTAEKKAVWIQARALSRESKLKEALELLESQVR